MGGIELRAEEWEGGSKNATVEEESQGGGRKPNLGINQPRQIMVHILHHQVDMAHAQVHPSTTRFSVGLAAPSSAGAAPGEARLQAAVVHFVLVPNCIREKEWAGKRY